MTLALQYFYFIYIIFCMKTNCTHANFFDWLWSKNENMKMIGANVPLKNIPFEAKTDDEKFLEEASKFTDIIKSSQLDICHHKVILNIKTSCSSMTEEDLSKMSVNLLNCQSAVDGRRTFPCTESMTLKECTVNMDGTMWNAYHMMNNRARAVCLAARRSQFQALSEMTVNKLMATAQDQIKNMKTVINSQDRLEKLTLGTINAIEKGNIELLEQQIQLKSTQKGIHDYISRNLRDFIKEKALINLGHRELSKMIQSIKEKIDDASNELKSQSVERMEYQGQLLEDIAVVQNHMKEIFDKIDMSTDKLLLRHVEATSKYNETLENLVKINETVHYLLTLVTSTRSEIDQRLHWIQEFLDGTGLQIGRISAIIFHVSYLLLGMIIASFLNFSIASRTILTLAVPLNLFLYSTTKPDLSLNYVQLTAILMIAVFTMHLINRVINRDSPHPYLEYHGVRSNFPPVDPPSGIITKSNTWRGLCEKLKLLVSSCAAFGIGRRSDSNAIRGDKYRDENGITGSRNENEDEEDYAPMNNTRDEVSSHRLVQEWLRTKVVTSPTVYSSSSGSQRLCSAICRSSRRRCRNVSSRGSEYCFRHMRQ